MQRREVSVIVTTNYSPTAFRRTFSVTAVQVLAGLAGVLVLLVLAGLVVSSVSALRLSRLAYLERRNRDLEVEFAKLVRLRQRVVELEEQGRRMAEMLGVEQSPLAIDWSAGGPGSLDAAADTAAWGSHPVPALAPVSGAAVSRAFTDGHEGVDLAARSGALVRAAADGVVLARGTDSVYGRFVQLGHLQGYETYYGHLKDWRVSSGDSVRLGQTIGLVGSTGRSSAPHLHFEVRKDRIQVNPAQLVRF